MAIELITQEEMLLVREFESMEADMMMNLAKKVLKAREAVCLFGSLSAGKVVLVHNQADLHAGKIFKETIQANNGRGGGGATSAQGSFQDAEDLKGFVLQVKETLLSE